MPKRELAAVLAALLLATSATAADLSGIVTATRDADTIEVDGQPVRLQGVDAPELREPGGHAARAFVADLVAGRRVSCELDGKRTYDRVVGVCRVGGRDIGEAVIAAGLARDCPRYSGGRYAAVETAAGRRLKAKRYCRARTTKGTR